MKTPKGKVEFAYCRFDDLPYGAEGVKTFMVPGESCCTNQQLQKKRNEK